MKREYFFDKQMLVSEVGKLSGDADLPVYLNVDGKFVRLTSVRLDGVLEDGEEETAVVLSGREVKNAGSPESK